jgi:hypothetical protein
VVSASRRDVVIELYRAFAWDVLFIPDESLKGPQWTSVSQQSLSMLRLYFDPELAQLIVSDRECVRRTHEICNLDFDPIFDGQDNSGASNLTVVAAGADKVVASFTYFSDSSHMKLVYTVKRAPGGFRISDIEYPNKRSLRALLKPGPDGRP